MTILEIILLGLIVNIMSVGVMLVLGIVISITKSIVDPINQTSEFMEVQKKFDELKALKLDLKNKGISNTLTDDFKILFPYAGILVALTFMYGVVTQGINLTFYKEFERKIELLESRLDK